MVVGKYLDTLVPEQGWSRVISKYTRVRAVEVFRFLILPTFQRLTIKQPSKAASETLNVQCALLQDTLQSSMQGQTFADLPDELKGNIGQLLEYVHRPLRSNIFVEYSSGN